MKQTSHPTAHLIRTQLEELSNPKKAEWLENYVKHDIKSLGVGIPEIRKILQGEKAIQDLTQQPINKQSDFLNTLMFSEWTEEKLAAIIYQQLYWKEVDTKTIIFTIEEWFEQTLIYDWNVCDWLCVRVMTPLIDNEPETTIPYMLSWNKSAFSWKARASLVPFAVSKNIFKHKSTIHELAKGLIQRPERFCKTAVGWTMRELSKHEPKYVQSFVKDNEKHFTKEARNNALKYLK